MAVEKIGPYELVETVGAGAMSTVYRAKESTSGEVVALKLLHSHLGFGENVTRFEREAHILSSLHHRNIVGIRTFCNEDQGKIYSVLDFIEGSNLSDFLKRERDLYADVAAMMILELAHGIAEAHAKAIIHRDLKPENILISKEGVLKISDFGLAHLWEGTDLTLPGARIGSPAYMSPEQIQGTKPSGRMDVFSLGILFYLFLTGELPFQAKSRREVFKLILGNPPVAPTRLNPDVPKALNEICLRMVTKDHPQRVTSADELIRLLEAYLDDLSLLKFEPTLERYLAGPKGGREEIRKWLLDAYLKTGKRAMEEGKNERALEVFRMVLVLTGLSTLKSGFSDEAQPTKKVLLRRPLVSRWVWLLMLAASLVVYFWT